MIKGVSNSFTKEIISLLEEARRYSARAVNSVITATYWEIGRRIVEKEQKGKVIARYGENLIEYLSQELTIRFGRGFSRHNLQQMRTFYLCYPKEKIRRTLSSESLNGPFRRTPSNKFPQLREFEFQKLSKAFPLSWSQYVLLLSVKTDSSRKFYEKEALRGGWSVRQLDRQINSLFYERTALSLNKKTMLIKGARPRPEDGVTPEEEVKSPYVLEFLGLKDEYSENQLEEALSRSHRPQPGFGRRRFEYSRDAKKKHDDGVFATVCAGAGMYRTTAGRIEVKFRVITTKKYIVECTDLFLSCSAFTPQQPPRPPSVSSFHP